MPLTQERLKNLLHYESETGKFFWKTAQSNNIKIGMRAGNLQGHGYRVITIDNEIHYAYDLAWLWTYGVWAKRIDHKNRIPDDDRIDNLREATRGQNRHNAKVNANNECGHKGVRWRRDAKRWQARIHVNKKAISLGHFLAKEDAIEAYKEAAVKYYGEYASTGE